MNNDLWWGWRIALLTCIAEVIVVAGLVKYSDNIKAEKDGRLYEPSQAFTDDDYGKTYFGIVQYARMPLQKVSYDPASLTPEQLKTLGVMGCRVISFLNLKMREMEDKIDLGNEVAYAKSMYDYLWDKGRLGIMVEDLVINYIEPGKNLDNYIDDVNETLRKSHDLYTKRLEQKVSFDQLGR